MTEQAMLVNVLTAAVSPIVIVMMLLEVGGQRVVMLHCRAVFVGIYAGGVRMHLQPWNAGRNHRYRKQHGQQSTRTKATSKHAVSVPQDEWPA